MDKKEQRKLFRSIRAKITPDDKKRAAEAITQRLIADERFSEAKQIFCYVSLPDEVSTDELMEYILGHTDKRLAVPRCSDSDGNMDFFYIDSMDMLEEGFFSVREPVKECPTAYPDEFTVCIVPALAFDRDGYRLGYGKGFYDRYFAVHDGIYKIGLCFHECLAEKIMHDDLDVNVDAVITDR